MKYHVEQIKGLWYVIDNFGYLASEDMSYSECCAYAQYLNNISTMPH